MADDYTIPPDIPLEFSERSKQCMDYVKEHCHHKDYPEGCVGIVIMFTFNNGLTIGVSGESKTDTNTPPTITKKPGTVH